MERFQRALVATLCRRLAERPEQIIAVFGPRQTGKTAIALYAKLWVGLIWRVATWRSTNRRPMSSASVQPYPLRYGRDDLPFAAGAARRGMAGT